jgi:GNAT superfamily N-acetyltransferase
MPRRIHLPAMNASECPAVEALLNGRRVEIRALKPADRAGLLEAVAPYERARYRRFFAPKRSFTEKEIEYYLDVDFGNYVALVAVVDEAAGQWSRAAGATSFRSRSAQKSPSASTTRTKGQGIGSALMRHLVTIARGAGLTELFAEVLPDNAPMLGVFKRSGLPMRQTQDGGVVHVKLVLGN